jgi:hypothetical protein
MNICNLEYLSYCIKLTTDNRQLKISTQPKIPKWDGSGNVGLLKKNRS